MSAKFRGIFSINDFHDSFRSNIRDSCEVCEIVKCLNSIFRDTDIIHNKVCLFYISYRSSKTKFTISLCISSLIALFYTVQYLATGRNDTHNKQLYIIYNGIHNEAIVIDVT